MIKKRINTLITLTLAAGLVVGTLAFLPLGEAQAKGPAWGAGYGTVSGSSTAAGRANGKAAQASGMGYRGWGAGAAQGAALGPLTEAEAQALLRAVQEEVGAQALYEGVLDAFGDVAPFSYIARSEAQHAAVLVRMANKYGIAVPDDQAPADLPAYESLNEACQAGVQAEIADAALYDELMTVTTHPDLLRVYTNLQSASLNNHLPAFEACR